MRRLTIGAVWLALALVGWAALGVYAVAWVVFPTATLIATTHVAAFFAGLEWRDRRRAVAADKAELLGEEVEARHLADAAVDGEHVNTNPDGKTLFGVHPARPVALYDQDAEDDDPSLPRTVPDAWRPANPGIGRGLR